MKIKLVSLAIAGVLATPSVSAIEVFKDEKNTVAICVMPVS